MSFQILEHVLLTGAGFTRNFGGFLAKDMWARIFNSPDIQSRPSLVRILKSDFDYESVYRKVVYGSYVPEDQEALTNAVTRAYEQLDRVVRSFAWRPGSQYPVNLYGVNNFLNRFVGKGHARGHIFTLNQDLFVERWYSRDEVLTIPGVLNHMPGLPMRRDLTQEDIKRLPGKGDMESIRAAAEGKVSSSGRFHYVKLHGSMNWRSSDGKNAMVIGMNKLEQIGNEPLLDWYFETFKKILSFGNRRLLVIGYGFCDSHINEVIARAIAKHELRWYAVSPSSPEDFKAVLFTRPYGKKLWKGFAGYFPYELKDVYPADQSKTEVAQEIIYAFFH